MKNLLSGSIAILTLCACAAPVPPLSPAASRVQVQSQNSNLLGKCKMLRPVSASASSINPAVADKIVGRSLMEQTAAAGGDVFVLTSKRADPNTMTLSIQGTAMKCYN